VNDFNRIPEPTNTAETTGAAPHVSESTWIPTFAGLSSKPLLARLWENLKDTVRDFVRHPARFFWHKPAPDEQGMFSSGLYFEPTSRSLFSKLGEFVRQPRAN